MREDNQLHLPYTGQPAGPSQLTGLDRDGDSDDADGHSDFADRNEPGDTSKFDDETEPGDESGGDGEVPDPQLTPMRTPPNGLSRRERHEWRQLELARLHRETRTAQRSCRERRTGWQQGFIRNPPPGLGRRGRKAWLAAERGATRAWWDQRRASKQDLQARSVGVLVIAVLLGGALLWVLFVNHSATSTRAAALAPAVPAAPVVAATPMPPVPLAPAGPDAAPTERLTGAVPMVTTLASTTAAAADQGSTGAAAPTDGAPPPVAGRWEPTPAGGVTPIRAVPAAPLDPAGSRCSRRPPGRRLPRSCPPRPGR